MYFPEKIAFREFKTEQTVQKTAQNCDHNLCFVYSLSVGFVYSLMLVQKLSFMAGVSI